MADETRRGGRSKSSMRDRLAVGAREAVDPEILCAAMSDVLDRLDVAVVLVDRYDQVLHHNVAAAELVRRHGSAVRIESGALRAVDRKSAAELHRIIQAATELPGEHVALHLEPERSWPVAIIAVAAQSMRELPVHERFATVFVSCGRRTGSAALLGQLYGLRDREIDVVEQLLHGRKTEDIARVLHISVHTVRSHLKGIFAKTGTRRQTEVSALFGGSLSVLRVPRKRRA